MHAKGIELPGEKVERGQGAFQKIGVPSGSSAAVPQFSYLQPFKKTGYLFALGAQNATKEPV
jgi:hypothetical protein